MQAKRKQNEILDLDTKEVDRVEFGIYSPKELIAMSVAKIENTKMEGRGSVYDERMGSNFDTINDCVTCELSAKNCPGHFGHIELNEPVVHPLFFRMVILYLRCLCVKCGHLLVTKDQIMLWGFDKLKRERRFDKILKKLEKIDSCPDCDHPQPKIMFSKVDSSFTMNYKQKNARVSVALSVKDIQRTFECVTDDDVRLLGFDPSLIHPRNLIMTVLPVMPPCARPFVMADGSICDDDLTNQFLEIIKSNNHLREDNPDMTDALWAKQLGCLKFRIATLFNNSQGRAKHTTSGRPIKGIKERIVGKAGLVRNNLMGKRCEFSGRTVIGPNPSLRMTQVGVPDVMAENLTFPEKVTAFNLAKMQALVSGDKANTVIKANGVRIILKYAMHRTPTPLLYGDMVIKEEIAWVKDMVMKQTDRVMRNDVVLPLQTHPKKGDRILRGVVENGGRGLFRTDLREIAGIQLAEGDRILRNDVILPADMMKYPGKKNFAVEVGDTVERHLQTGDVVLMNRQPTLHVGSMMAMTVVRHPHKTLQMNLACCKSFNADFDGDEMNIHAPQSQEARAELLNLSLTKKHLISAQSGNPNITIVQDALLGAYKMTYGTYKLTPTQFQDVSLAGSLNGAPLYTKESIQRIRQVLKKFGKKLHAFSGKGLVSLILPSDFNYTSNNKAHPDEPTVKIYRGVLYEGTLNKDNLGKPHNTIIQVLYKDYGEDVAAEFVDNIQFITNKWLLISGFSVGMEDCLISKVKNPETGMSKTDEINAEITKCYIKAKGIEHTTHNPGIREIRVNAALNEARDIGLKIAKDALHPDNDFIKTAMAGSKGDFVNIAQITGLLGQQNLLGKRIPQLLNHGKRTLPHYPLVINGSTATGMEMEFESRGFIRHSYIHGLNPQEFYFQAMSGREGICDTATGTASSGYIQRRLVKLCEDIQVKYDGTVRDAAGRVYQLAYGENGLDSTKLIKMKAGNTVCDVARLVERLNMKAEMSI